MVLEIVWTVNLRTCMLQLSLYRIMYHCYVIPPVSAI